VRKHRCFLERGNGRASVATKKKKKKKKQALVQQQCELQVVR
jgi:hypothetical protein